MDFTYIRSLRYNNGKVQFSKCETYRYSRIVAVLMLKQYRNNTFVSFVKQEIFSIPMSVLLEVPSRQNYFWAHFVGDVWQTSFGSLKKIHSRFWSKLLNHQARALRVHLAECAHELYSKTFGSKLWFKPLAHSDFLLKALPNWSRLVCGKNKCIAEYFSVVVCVHVCLCLWCVRVCMCNLDSKCECVCSNNQNISC